LQISSKEVDGFASKNYSQMERRLAVEEF